METVQRLYQALKHILRDARQSPIRCEEPLLWRGIGRWTNISGVPPNFDFLTLNESIFSFVNYFMLFFCHLAALHFFPDYFTDGFYLLKSNWFLISIIIRIRQFYLIPFKSGGELVYIINLNEKSPEASFSVAHPSVVCLLGYHLSPALVKSPSV